MSNIINTIVSAIVVDGPDAGQPVVGYRIDPSGAVTAIPVPPADTALDEQDVNDVLLGAVAADWDVTPLDALTYLGAVEDTATGQPQNAVMVFARGRSLRGAHVANPAADAVISALGFGVDTQAAEVVDGSVWVFYGPEASARLGEIPAVLGAVVVDTAARFNHLGETGPAATDLLADGAMAITAWRMVTGQVPVPPEFAGRAAADPSLSPELADIIAGLAGQPGSLAITATDVDDAPTDLGDVLAMLGITDDVIDETADQTADDDLDNDLFDLLFGGDDEEVVDDLDDDEGDYLADLNDVFVIDMSDGVTDPFSADPFRADDQDTSGRY